MSEGGLLRGAPAYQPSSPWRPGPALAAFVAIIGLMQGIAYLGPMLTPGMEIEADAELRALAVAQAVGIVLVLAASGLHGARPAQVLALHPPAAGWHAYAVGAVATLLWPLLAAIPLAIVAAFIGSVDPAGDWDLQDDFQQGASLSLQVAALVIGAPLAEELICRGFLLSALAQTRLGFWGAAVIVTVLWTALHPYSTFGLAKVFLAGLLLSWILRRTGSLRVTIACHALNNTLALLMSQLVEFPAAG